MVSSSCLPIWNSGWRLVCGSWNTDPIRRPRTCRSRLGAERIDALAVEPDFPPLLIDAGGSSSPIRGRCRSSTCRRPELADQPEPLRPAGFSNETSETGRKIPERAGNFNREIFDPETQSVQLRVEERPLSQSPTILTETTSRISARPGKKVIHHCPEKQVFVADMDERCRATVCLVAARRQGSSKWASVTIARAKLTVASTRTGPSVFGKNMRPGQLPTDCRSIQGVRRSHSPLFSSTSVEPRTVRREHRPFG